MDKAAKYKPKNCYFYEAYEGDPPPGVGWSKELNGNEIESIEKLAKEYRP